MKVLLTGANGFIGSHLKKSLQVVSLDRELLYAPRLLKNYIELSHFTHVIHCASYGNLFTQKDIIKTVEANYTTTKNLLNALTNEQLVLFSSSSVHLPKQTVYSLSKQLAEHLASEYGKYVIIRPYSVYGYGDNPVHFIPTIMQAFLTQKEIELDPTPTHDWIHIDDIVEATKQALTMPSGTIIEAGTGVSTTNEDVVRILETVAGLKPTIRMTHHMRDYDSIEWRAPRPCLEHMTPLSEGLKQLYAQYKT